ncbi:MAG: hypothetical protein OIF50_08215 [Flavobacteriaceae bacterium]|nr:hypothetical protein [Flavobacteriaceae bacterium]
MSSFYKKWLDTKVPHLIYENPKSSNLKNHHLKDAPNVLYFSDTVRSPLFYAAAFVVILAILAFIFIEDHPLVVVGLLLGFAILLGFVGSLPDQFYTYKRLDGEVTFPPPTYGDHYTIQFKNACFFWAIDGLASGAIRTLTGIAPPGKKTGIHIATGCSNGVEDLSFLVWYMDKNRPLPPDPIFDPYRDADFERRKAEGFPPPLYKSQIPTPEATPVQQKEREKYWKDRDYYKMSESIWI